MARRPVRAPRAFRVGFACFGLWLALAPLRAEAQARELESAIKATFLYKFIPFVEWPAGTFAGPTDPLRLCVVGNDAVGQLVEEAVRGQPQSARPVVVQRLSNPARESGCHVVYVAPGKDDAAAAATLERLRGLPVLTITDGARDARSRGMINFVVRDNRVRFEIDLGLAIDSGLAISSKLLALAVSVRSPT
jgi:hypothetical protein